MKAHINCIQPLILFHYKLNMGFKDQKFNKEIDNVKQEDKMLIHILKNQTISLIIIL